MTNLERLHEIDNAEEMVDAIYHAMKMASYYTDSRRGMAIWLKDDIWDRIKDAHEKLNRQWNEQKD